jgi:asparagine synthase (glutamine-hydrolysing)
MARDHLTGPASLTRAWYEPKVLDSVLDEHDKGRKGHEELLWTLLNLEIWHRTQSAAHA